MVALTLETYGKAVLVKGDTKPVKDALKGLKGSWNGKCGGWIFPGGQKSKVLEFLRELPVVSSVADNTGSSTGAAPAADKAEPAKRKEPAAAGESKSVSSADDLDLDIGDLFRVKVNAFQGKKGVDIRKHYKDQSSGEDKPTGKGVRVSPALWEALCGAFGKLDEMLKTVRVDDQVAIQDDLFVTVAPTYIDIRKFYADKSDGQQKPGKQGARISRANWEALKAARAQIDTALGSTSSSATEPAAKKNENC